MLFERRIHPYSEEFVARDYFPETDTSLFDEKSAEGCFSSGEYIPIRRNSSPGIIFPRRIHPYSMKSPLKDAFPRGNASLKAMKAL